MGYNAAMRYVLAVGFGLVAWGVLGELYKPTLAIMTLYLLWAGAKRLVGEFARHQRS